MSYINDVKYNIETSVHDVVRDLNQAIDDLNSSVSDTINKGVEDLSNYINNVSYGLVQMILETSSAVASYAIEADTLLTGYINTQINDVKNLFAVADSSVKSYIDTRDQA